MQHTSLSYQRGRHNLSVGNVTLKSNSALKKRGKYQIFMYLPTYVPVSLFAQCFDFLFTGISISLGLSSQEDLKKGENVHLYLQGKQSN